MRGMRGFAWYHILFIVPVLGLAFGIQHIVRKRHAGGTQSETAAVTKPSRFHQDGKDEGKESKESKETSVAADSHSRGKVHKKKHAEPEGESEDFEAALDATLKESRRPASLDAKSDAAGHTTSQQVVVKLDSPVNTHGESACNSVEYRGEGPSVALKSEEWELVMGQYAEVKRRLLGWLEKNRKGFPERAVSFMERQILSAKLERPPVASQPDLAWRGIGVLAFEGKSPVVHLGSGFVKLAKREPNRAKFELARLIAQSFAPCEMRRNEIGEPWNPLLQCLQVNDQSGCGKGTYSEAGWAVSTAVASSVAAPGCSIAAFRNPEVARCVTKMPFPMNMAEMILPQGAKTLWKESQR